MQFSTLFLGFSAILAPVFAQTFTNCDPTKKTCPNDPALGTSNNFVFNTSRTVTDSFNITEGALTYGNDGAAFVINKQKDSPTIQSHFYIFFGSVSVIMKAASGQGIISSIVLESDDLDEIDWEFMGGDGVHAETNYFGKGNQTVFDRAFYYPVSSDVRDNFHNYTLDWTSERLLWIIDGVTVRTLLYADANGGKNYPQTPMTVRMGIWAGGDVKNNAPGTVQWAGGATDFSKVPFTMTVQSAYVNDYSTGKEYQWTDKTGSFQSIKAIAGESNAATTITNTQENPNSPDPNASTTSSSPTATPTSTKSSTGSAASATTTSASNTTATASPSIAQKFQALPQTTKLAIYGGAGGVGALLLAAILFTCIRQRRAGRKEREAYNAAIEKQREDAYRDQLELREKGLGGWDAHSTQGDDALGGWGGTHVTPGDNSPPLPKAPGNVSYNEFPSRVNSPSPSRVDSPGAPSRINTSSPAPLLSRQNTSSPAPLLSPQSQYPPSWNGGNQGGMIHSAGNAYSGGYGGNTNIPRSPSYAQHPQVPQQRGFGGFPQQQGGYSRF